MSDTQSTPSTPLTCDRCGNTAGWRNARQDASGQRATCGNCGHRVVRTGGVTIVGAVTDMEQTR